MYVLLVIALVVTGTLGSEENKSDRSEYKKALKNDCDNNYGFTCLKLDIVSWVDKLNENEEISVYPGVNLVREKNSAQEKTSSVVAEIAREFPDDPNARLNAFVLKKIANYLSSHSLKLNLIDEQTVKDAFTARDGGGSKGGGLGGGKGGKKGGGLGMLMAAGAMMKGMMMTMAMAGIAAIAGKALMTGLIALVLSAVIGLKSLAGGGGGTTTYEVVAKPIHTTHHTHHDDHGGYGHSSYGRSLDQPLPIALQPGYKPY